MPKGELKINNNIIVAPSLLACDFTKIGEQITFLENRGIKYLHLDIMDGIFVPNISFGQPLIKSIRKISGMIFDVHLMITDPIRYIDDFVSSGADIITIHYEAADNCREVLEYIRSKKIQSGLSIKPDTAAEKIFPLLDACDMVLIMSVEPGFGGQKFMPSALPKVEKIKKYITNNNLKVKIEIDGGIDATNAKLCANAGVDILVAGSSVFEKEDIAAAAAEIANSCGKGV